MAAICAVFSVAAAITAVVHQSKASRPIGEGQLFYSDAQLGMMQIDQAVSSGMTPDDAVRHLRNLLRIEGVALVDSEGAITAATSDPLIGGMIDNPVLQYALGSGRFAAVAAPIDQDLEIDGVPEWQSGEALYLALLPGAEGNPSLLLYYDISELLARRAGAAGVQTATVQLAAVALFFAIAGLAVLIGRSHSIQRYREMALEAEFLRKDSESLQIHNAELDVARRNAEAALALAEEKNRIRAEFVLMINHELRTPLTSVVTGAELLLMTDTDGADRYEILEALVHDGRRLQTMIDQLLAVARAENRGLSSPAQPVRFSKACEAVALSHSKVISSHSPDSHSPDTDPTVMTDLQTLRNLAASLADNAFTHGARNVRIHCSTEEVHEPHFVVGTVPDSAVYISISDDGPGIRPEFLPRAFEKFEKDSRSSGTGLGLYMARLMAEAMDASLMVWTASQGTTFTIALPLARVTSELGAA
ncbi:MAG: HAMP domain-containing sensor histidine kinase [Acidimicrobiia bacterium]